MFLNKLISSALPVEGTDVARTWDNLYFFLFYLCLFFFVIVIVPLIFFAIRYRAGAKRPVSYISHNTVLESIWTLVPTAILMIVFAWGWIVYEKMVSGPANAYEIHVIAKQWVWTFQYDDGRMSANKLYVPVNTPIRLVMTSEQDDVIHGFWIPNFRIKKDVVPGAYSYVNFTPKIVGQHQILCSMYCGTGHSSMLAKVVVLSPEDWKLWKWGKEVPLPDPVGLGSMKISDLEKNEQKAELENASDANHTVKTAMNGLAVEGKKITQDLGCIACHSDDGSKRIGPSYKGIYKHTVEFNDGSKMFIDDKNIHSYVTDILEKPHVRKVKGYEAVTMPPYSGQVSQTQINAVVEYLKSLD